MKDKVFVNGNLQFFEKGWTLSMALKSWGCAQGKFAVAVNGEFVPRSEYEKIKLKAKDHIDLVVPVQGG